MLGIFKKIIRAITNRDALDMLEKSEQAVARAEKRNGESFKMMEEIDRMLNKGNSDAR